MSNSGGDGFGRPPPFGGGFSSFSSSSQPRPFVSNPSSGPANSTLQNEMKGLSLPDLAGVIRHWHKGSVVRGPTGERVTIPVFALEVIHLDTATVVYTHDWDISESDDDVCHLIESKIDQRARAFDGGRFEVRCHFRSDDGTLRKWEPWTGNVTLPPQAPSWGQPHYGGFGGGSGGMGGMGGMGGGFGGYGGNHFGSPQSQHAVFLRANIDAQQGSDAMTLRALDMMENVNRRNESMIARYQEQEMDRFRLIAELQNTARQQRLDDQMLEMKMAAIHTAMEKFFSAAPLALTTFNRWIQLRREEKQGTITPRQQKAEEVLKRIYLEAQKGPSGGDPNNVRAMLQQGAGISEETVDDAFALFQEYSIDAMMLVAQKKTRESLLGMGDGADSGIERLKKAAGIGVNESPANDEAKKASEGGK